MDNKNLMDYLSERELLIKIEEGLKNNEFKMYLQFLVDSKTKKITSFEALSRWQNPAGEVIFPGEYIGLMEKSGIIVNFDYYMFEKVCKKLSEWKDTEFFNYSISCNITRITISEDDFANKINEIAQRYDFDRANLIVEITEDALEGNMDIAKNNILKVKEMGFVIALDDIGSGYSTVENLSEYAVDVVKLDRKFLLMTDTREGKELFNGFTSVLHEIGFKVVCEGVETKEQDDFVTLSNCDYIQGWFYSKAIPVKDAEKVAKEYMEKL